MALRRFQEPTKFVHNTCILGSKRVLVYKEMEDPNLSSPFSTPPAKRHGRNIQLEGSDRLESLPQDILVRVLCKVTHGDLKQLLLVSKLVKEAALIAKESHFAYSTPTSKPIFCQHGDVGINELEDSVDAPNAPKCGRVCESRIAGKDLSSITVELFK